MEIDVHLAWRQYWTSLTIPRAIERLNAITIEMLRCLIHDIKDGN